MDRRKEKNMTDTITLLHYAAIVVLEAYIIYSEVRLWMILKRRSDIRTNNRRAFYRVKAYKELDERTALKNARQALWRSVRK